ncbi:MAG: RNA polymerase sigma factor [Flavisolibacter sp.]|jgi:RNA polymerase sigma factor (sigma-70 family)
MQNLLPHLFRSEFRKIVSVLCRQFGFEQMEIAEDIASDTFMTAAQTWSLNGVPENPVAWLYAVARNKSNNLLLRDTTFRKKILPEIRQITNDKECYDIDLSEQNITDSQLQMMFAICHPSISVEAQVGLSLRILCGFGIDEIADAFLTKKETITKRLFRAKEKLREENIRIEMPPVHEIDQRLGAVLTTIYLLFSEGYYSSSDNHILRKDFCLEAIRLCYMLVENPITDKSPVNALLSLMCFHASRFDARIGENGELILYNDQDTSLWNMELVNKGVYFLNRSSGGNFISSYHLEAAIAYWHTRKEDSIEKWENILQLYNRLLQIRYSPVAALNRTFALSKVHGKEIAIGEAEKLQLINNHFYFTLLGELYQDLNNNKSMENFEKALLLAKTDTDKKTILEKLERLNQMLTRKR